MKHLLITLLIVFAGVQTATAAVLRHDSTRDVTYVADAGTIAAYRDGRLLWEAPATRTPSELLLLSGGGAVLSSLEQEIVWFDLSGGTSVTALDFIPGEAVAAGDAVIVASRSSGALVRLARNGQRTEAAGSYATAVLRRSADRVIAYDRISGMLGEYDLASLEPIRNAHAEPFASDLEASERHVYLSYPRSGEVHVIDRSSGAITERLSVGAVPVDIALAGDGNLLRAGEILVADPSSKRVWREEQSQSAAAAFGRGFTRGLIGLGLYKPRSSEFPTGVDRLLARSGSTIAYDSSSATLYLLGGKTKALPLRIGALEFDLASDGTVIVWDREQQRPLTLRVP